MRAFDLYQRKCEVCGKRFESCVEYAYKVQKKKHKDRYYYFCSWRCLRQYQNVNAKGGRKGA